MKGSFYAYPKKYVCSVRKRVEEKTGIPGGNIMICSIHTHSGPEMTARFDLEGIERELKPDAENIHMIEDRIVLVIIDAIHHPFPAKIGIGKGYCGKEQGVGGNRRDPDGLADPEVWVIGIKDSSDRWKGCAVRYALHPTVIHGESRLVTADYPCYIREFLEESKPGLTAMFLQGTSGNQSPRYFRSGQTFGEARRIGEAIGREAGRVLDTMTFSSHVELSCTPWRPQSISGSFRQWTRLSKISGMQRKNSRFWNHRTLLMCKEGLQRSTC